METGKERFRSKGAKEHSESKRKIKTAMAKHIAENRGKKSNLN